MELDAGRGIPHWRGLGQDACGLEAQEESCNVQEATHCADGRRIGERKGDGGGDGERG